MGRKKHQFHCQHCGSPCDIYKKGKGHRVLVCPHCGIIATNPGIGAYLKSFGREAKKAGAGIVSGAQSGGISGAVGGALGYVMNTDGSGGRRVAPKGIYEGKEHRNLTSFEKAVLLEAAEHGRHGTRTT